MPRDAEVAVVAIAGKSQARSACSTFVVASSEASTLVKVIMD